VASCPVVNTPLSGPLSGEMSGPLSDEVETLSVAEVAARLSVPVTRVHQYVRDGQLLAVPADFLDGNAVVKGLSGTITVLRDGGYSDDEILRWLFADDDSLPGTPVASLCSGRHKEVKRRAQAMAF
jgi:hypothetical protein